MGDTTPGAGTLADEQGMGAADVTRAAGSGSTPAPVTPAAENKDPTAISRCARTENKDPTAISRCARDPDRLRNSLARSGKEGVSQGMELHATAGAGSTLDP